LRGERFHGGKAMHYLDLTIDAAGYASSSCSDEAQALLEAGAQPYHSADEHRQDDPSEEPQEDEAVEAAEQDELAEDEADDVAQDEG
jgi:hypothetical protein